MNIQETVQKQKLYFQKGNTFPVSSRIKALKALLAAVNAWEDKILAALRSDLNKSPAEAYMTEIGMVKEEISFQLKHLKKFAAKKRVKTPLAQFKAKSYTYPAPYGVVLIMSPWNYPFQLTLAPLADAIAAGNCAVVKPSAYAPQTAQVIADLLKETFDPDHIAVILGGRAENTELIQQKYDMIFFTGGSSTGRVVAEAAAKNLTPVVLELGGKSPCIVNEDANIPLAAKRIAFGKFLNAGQTCVAPDYVLVHRSVHAAFLEALETHIINMYGENALTNPDYPKIVNAKHFARILSLVAPDKIVFGGDSDESALKIAPTVLDGVTFTDRVMSEEIFGPVLPVIEFESYGQIAAAIAHHPTPLALYYFGKESNLKQRILREIQFGGGCVNDTIIHLATTRMGFGGVGESGMGAYHGERGFFAFSHVKSIVEKSTAIDIQLRYAPYNDKKTAQLKKFLR